MLSLFYQLPNCNLFTQHVLFIYGETPQVNCGPRSYLHHIAITWLLYSHCLLYSHTILFSTRYAHNLCFKQTGEIDNLIACWEQSTWLCVCRFHITFSRLSLLSWSINLGILTEGKLAAILIIPSSWGSQRAGHSPRIRTICYTPAASFLAPSTSSSFFSGAVVTPRLLLKAELLCICAIPWISR
jgi:hypothetical protein